jgi:hypothetical protein
MSDEFADSQYEAHELHLRHIVGGVCTVFIDTLQNLRVCTKLPVPFFLTPHRHLT